MFLVICIGTVASERGLCNIDRVFSGVTKSQKSGSPGKAKTYRYTDYIEIEKSQVINLFSSCKDFSIIGHVI